MKVIYFDSWAQGAKYYKELDLELSRNGCETKLLHIERLIGNSLPEQAKQLLKRNKNCIEHKIECEDASWDGDDYLKKILAEKPDAVVMLSITRIENRLVTRYCQIIGIPVYYMQHGSLFSNQSTLNEDINSIRKRNKYKIIKKIKKLIYYLRVTLVYINNIGVNEGVRQFFDLIRNPYSYVWNPRKCKSLILTRAYSYSKKDSYAINQFFKIPLELIKVVGNPRMYGIDSYVPSIKSYIISNFKKNEYSKYVLYIDQAFVESGAVSQNDHFEMIECMAKNLSSRNIDLIVKLHPRAILDNHKNLQNISGCYVVQDGENLTELIYFAEFVIGHSSTALTEALYMNKLVFCFNDFDDGRRADLFDQKLSVIGMDEVFQVVEGTKCWSKKEDLSDFIYICDSSPARKIADDMCLK